MRLTHADIEEELTALLQVAVDDPKWFQSPLLNLPILERQFEASRQSGIRPAEANLNLALCLLQSTNQLVPASVLGSTRQWKMLIGAELNCLGAVRGFAASILKKRVPETLELVFRECSSQTSLPASELGKAEPPALKELVRRAIAALWLWKTGSSPFGNTATDWVDLLNRFSVARTWTRDVTYAQRDKFIAELAKSLASDQIEGVGVGPQAFTPTALQTPIASGPDDKSDKTIDTAGLKQDIVTELISQLTVQPAAAPVKSAVDTIDLYLSQSLPLAPSYIPTEWRAWLISARALERVVIQGSVGSGKTHLLYAIGQELKRAGLVPLYMRLSEYAPHAGSMDILHFMATLGSFGQEYREESMRQDFEVALTEARRNDRLVLLADQADDLFESEWSLISERLKEFSRFILAERSPRLLIDRGSAVVVRLPNLSEPSVKVWLTANGVPSTAGETLMAAAQRLAFQFNPALTVLAQRAIGASQDSHPAALLNTWIDHALKQPRSAGKLVAETNNARRLLRYLAANHTGIFPESGTTHTLGREDVQQAFRWMRLPEEDEEQGWLLIDLCVRSGLLTQIQEHWAFVDMNVERFLAAELALDDVHWLSLRPRYQPLMKWLAALAARQEAGQQQSFFDRLHGAQSQWSKLSALDVADIAIEFNACKSQPAQEFKDEVMDWLRDLAHIDSDQVRMLIQEKAQALGVTFNVANRAPEPLFPADELDRSAGDLSSLLRYLGLPKPASSESVWLEDRDVLRGLVNSLVRALPLEVKVQCAAWLRRSSLAKIVTIDLYAPQVWNSRRLTALEAVAQMASDPDRDTLTRQLAKSILIKDDFTLRLWRAGDKHYALVYDLLLALDRRIYLYMNHLAPNKSEWRITD